MKSLLRHRILTLLAGIATASVIIFSQLFYFQAATFCQQKAKTEKHEEKKDVNDTYVSIPSSSIATTSNIELNQDISFILETLLEGEQEEESGVNFSLPVNQFFQTLFRFVISPNAP